MHSILKELKKQYYFPIFQGQELNLAGIAYYSPWVAKQGAQSSYLWSQSCARSIYFLQVCDDNSGLMTSLGLVI